MHLNQLDTENRELVRETIHTLKGQGGTFGYNLISTIATQADSTLGSLETLKPADIDNLINHVAAISLVVSKQLSGHGGKPGRILLQALKDFS